jgi:hypothetical protein
LAGIFERHRMPMLPRGDWAKIEAGQKVKKTLFQRVTFPVDRLDPDCGYKQYQLFHIIRAIPRVPW